MENTTEQATNYEYDYDFAVTDAPGSASFQVLYMSHIYVPMLYFIMFFAGFSGNLFVLNVIGAHFRLIVFVMAQKPAHLHIL